MEIMFDKRLTCPNSMTLLNSNQPTLELVALTTYPNHMTFLNMGFIFDYRLA